MGQPKADPSTLAATPPSDDRLESWKEIAAYLRRGVRTVQRWEREEGLPVHRHVHDKLGTVYAFKPEIDTWWAGRRTQLEPQGTPLARLSRRPWLWAAAATAVVVAGGTVATWWFKAPALPFEERDWVLIAQFENRTGEPVFDGTLEYALERELSNSRFVNVVPRERVNDTLQLMKKPTDTILTASLARELALRDGGIRALLTGRVEKLDNTYLLSVALVNPASGATVRSFSEEAAGQKEVVSALRRLSAHTRQALGEALPEIKKSEQELEKVTTPSLRALQLFSQADQALSQPIPVGPLEEVLRRQKAQSMHAEELLQQAVAEDPEFASAYISLAWAIHNQERPHEALGELPAFVREEEYHRYAERAVELSPKVSERERYFILGSYYQLTRAHEKAIVQYEALVRAYPDHYWGNVNLAGEYRRLGRWGDMVPYVKHRADLRPKDPGQNCRTAMALQSLSGSLDEARPYIVRVRQLSTPELAKRDPICAAYIELLFPSYEHMLEGRVEKVLAEADRVTATLPSRAGEERAALAGMVAGLYRDMGLLKRAEGLTRGDWDPAIVHSNLAWIALDRGDSQGFKRHVREMSRYPRTAWWLGVAIHYARAGLLIETDQWIREHPDAVGIEIVRGELALARGQKAEGLRLLKQGYSAVRKYRGGEFFDGTESLARVLEEQGDLEGALQVLELAFRERVLAMIVASGARWNRLRHQQARLYRKLGREAEAEPIENELRKLLAYADEDHALARELRALSAQAARP